MVARPGDGGVGIVKEGRRFCKGRVHWGGWFIRLLTVFDTRQLRKQRHLRDALQADANQRSSTATLSCRKFHCRKSCDLSAMYSIQIEPCTILSEG